MSEEMAVSDNTTVEEANVNSDEIAAIAEPEEAIPAVVGEPAAPEADEDPAPVADSPPPEVDPEEQGEPADRGEVLEELQSEELDIPPEPIKVEPEVDIKVEREDIPELPLAYEENGEEEKDDKRGIKRRASSAFSENGDEDVKGEEFKGFDDIKLEIKTEEYNRVLERLEAEVTAARKSFVPLRTVMATPPAPTRASKRPRKDTEGSRPSSALSSRSDGDGSTDPGAAGSSPAARGRRVTEMSSLALRVPLERGWKRELVYRAALDAHSRRNADIYYYTPSGKKLRSSREVGEHLSGTGLTLENFSFCKEALGVDDPEKEIIRDAKLIRRVDSPIAATTAPVTVEGKRTPKPKAPKGASPEPTNVSQTAAAIKSPPAKIKQVKSVGSRLSGSTPAAATPPAPKQQQQQQQKKAAPPPTTPDNNNTAWKKPRYRIMYNYTALQQILSLGFD